MVQGGEEVSASKGNNDEMLERVLAARKAVLRKGWKAAVGGGGGFGAWGDCTPGVRVWYA